MVRGLPVVLRAGSKGTIIAHSASVKSLAYLPPARSCRRRVSELRPCFRTPGYFTPVHERGTKWDSNQPAHHALTTYRKRRAIECLFAEAKTKGFNLEDTRLPIAKKLSLSVGLVALAMAWAARVASTRLGTRKRPRKSHGRYAKSIFRIGLDEIRRLLRTSWNKPSDTGPKSGRKSHESCTGDPSYEIPDHLARIIHQAA